MRKQCIFPIESQMAFGTDVLKVRLFVSDQLVLPTEFLRATGTGEGSICRMDIGVSVEFCKEAILIY